MENTSIVRTDSPGLPDVSGLSENERKFCELYAKGVAPYAGNPVKCYEEAFASKDPLCGMKAYTLLSRPDVQSYLTEISVEGFDETAYIKEFVKTNMMSIITEMGHSKFVDRKGNPVSQAAARGVAVSAAKVLLEMYKIKEPNSNEVNISNKDGGNITFNVIVPESKKKELANEE